MHGHFAAIQLDGNIRANVHQSIQRGRHHRRNIAAKLQIHSAAGLTIYAIVNKLVELSEIKDTITDPQP